MKSPKKVTPKIEYREVVVTLPGKEGKLDTAYFPIPIIKENPINIELQKKYNVLQSDKEKKEAYEDAITENEYNEVYEDSLVKISVYSKVVGKLAKQSSSYFIKPSTHSFKDSTFVVTPFTPKNHLYGGIEIGVPINISPDNNLKPVVKANLIFQNKKGNSINVSYDTNETVWVGKTWKFF